MGEGGEDWRFGGEEEGRRAALPAGNHGNGRPGCSEEGRNSCQIRAMRVGWRWGSAMRSWFGSWSNHKSLAL